MKCEKCKRGEVFRDGMCLRCYQRHLDNLYEEGLISKGARDLWRNLIGPSEVDGYVFLDIFSKKIIFDDDDGCGPPQELIRIDVTGKTSVEIKELKDKLFELLGWSDDEYESKVVTLIKSIKMKEREV